MSAFCPALQHIIGSKLQPCLIGIGNICIAKGRSQDGGLSQIDIEDLFLTLVTGISKESDHEN